MIRLKKAALGEMPFAGYYGTVWTRLRPQQAPDGSLLDYRSWIIEFAQSADKCKGRLKWDSARSSLQIAHGLRAVDVIRQGGTGRNTTAHISGLRVDLGWYLRRFASSRSSEVPIP
jgi:hypothetical protein